MIEQEVKLELADLESWRRVADAFAAESSPPPRLVAQTNYYLDTGDLALAGALVMLRIRESEEEGVVLTLKSGTRIEAGLFRSREVEAPLDAGLLEALLGAPERLYELDLSPISTLRSEYGDLPLELIGTLRNERRIFSVDGHTVELDRMQFEGGAEEFELEIESPRPEEAREWCLGRLRALGVAWRPGRETKFQRLLRRLGGRAPGGG